MEKVISYKAKNGMLYKTVTDAMISDFSRDNRMKRVAADICCGSENLAWALWNNREDVVSLLKDMEKISKEQE